MNGLWPGRAGNDAAEDQKDFADIADTGFADVPLPVPEVPLINDVIENEASGPSLRPQLQRNQPQAPPPLQPPPPPSPQQVGGPADSLSLAQLKRLVHEFPKVETAAYAFTYSDTASYEEEIEEWFSYNDAEFVRLLTAADTFKRRWRKFSDGNKSWADASQDTRNAFVMKQIGGLKSGDLKRRCKALQAILYVVLGAWEESVVEDVQEPKTKEEGIDENKFGKKVHLEHMADGMAIVAMCDAVSTIYQVLKNALEHFWGDAYQESQIPEEELPLMQDELDNVTTIMYMLIEGARNEPEKLSLVKRQLKSLQPSLVQYLMTVTSKLRWDDANELPQTRIFLLFWKSCLLIFGSTADLQEVKKATSERPPGKEDKDDLITASPLDYHLFRSEITSKYPAYVPPPCLLPLDNENNNILPPLPNHPIRNNGTSGIIASTENSSSSGASILHQPVHIATPAPSPPPTPPLGGKAGKKQNYQTNQNFPFMYPPLDSTSNSAGGKGAAGLQESLVGRKWEGSDIPASILEAGKLFADRTRMTRSMRQLWDEREKFQRFERGWDDRSIDKEDIEELDLETIFDRKLKIEKSSLPAPEIDYGPRPGIGEDIKIRLDTVESFYKESLPHLQSLVIVLLKSILANVTALITQPTAQQHQGGLGGSFQSEGNLGAANLQGQRRPQDAINFAAPNAADIAELPIADLEALRSREITAKAVAGILITLLKWFKVSHILKFEYLTQLLLDSNYIPLVLKLFAHQDIDKVVDCKSDREQLSFFAFCNANSKDMVAKRDPLTESDDDAAPPPIKTRRWGASTDDLQDGKLPALSFQSPDAPAAAAATAAAAAATAGGRRSPPQVDELGYPLTSVPSAPLTDFSGRNFLTAIKLLAALQKMCKHKAHRNLLLVQYKSSGILKKALRVPQAELRLYTLKLFKGQVPYCGRKWRQGNMRVITAVYLHCRPELRDDWLAGSDVDAEVEEALPLEQALRALTHWSNVRRYPDMMGAEGRGWLEEERDFFVRELEKMEWGGGFWSDDGAVDDSLDGSMWE